MNNKTAYITHHACFEHNMGEGHPESPERLYAIKQALIENNIFQDLVEITAREADDEDILRAHSHAYLDYLKQSSPSVGTFRLDTDTAMNSGTIKSIRYAAGAVMCAVDTVMNGVAQNAFCAIRPPGHHATIDQAMGFCFINNISIGAKYALEKYNLDRILVVDFDIHHGNGTEMILKDNPHILFLSSFQKHSFPYCGDLDPNNTNIIRTPLPESTGSIEFREAILELWLPEIQAFKPQLVMISAGFDAHILDDMGGFNLKETDFAWITRQIKQQAIQHCDGKIVSVLEGGYHIKSLAISVLEHIKALQEDIVI